MTPIDFVKIVYPEAIKSQAITGFDALAMAAQAADETGWGNHVSGNNLFGVKDDNKNHNGNEQLIVTTEYSRLQNQKFGVETLSVVPVIIDGKQYYKYTIKDWFVRYDTYAESFTDHANYFIRNPRYAEALKVKGDTEAFITAIAKAGYATDPGYAAKLISISHTIKRLI